MRPPLPPFTYNEPSVAHFHIIPLKVGRDTLHHHTTTTKDDGTSIPYGLWQHICYDKANEREWLASYKIFIDKLSLRGRLY